MARIEYTKGTPLGKHDVQHKYLKEIKANSHNKRRAQFECGYCSTKFESTIDTVKSGRRYSCGCMNGQKPDAYVGGTRPDKYDTPDKLRGLLEALKRHRSQGLSYESFEECDKLTLQSYYLKHPDIFTAERIHEINASAHRYYESIGIAGMLGRIGDWITEMDIDGKPLVDKKTGAAIRKFHRRQFNSSVFTLMVKNILGWQAEPEPMGGDEGEGDGIIYELPDGTVLNEDGSIEHFNG